MYEDMYHVRIKEGGRNERRADMLADPAKKRNAFRGPIYTRVRVSSWRVGLDKA